MISPAAMCRQISGIGPSRSLRRTAVSPRSLALRWQRAGLLRDLPALGELKYGRITEASWADLIAFSSD